MNALKYRCARCWLLATSFVLISNLPRLEASDAGKLLHNWRSASHGGVNSLYCYLGVNGIPCDYVELLTEATQNGKISNSAGALIQLASKYGAELKARSLTMNELATCTLPVIVHIDGESPEAGAFLLLWGIGENGVYFVNGPSASMQSMDAESFRRVWSGVTLVPPGKISGPPLAFLGGIALGLVLFTTVRAVGRRSMK